MAQYKVLDPEEEMICPYDPNHRPRARGMQAHLVNCRKNNPHMKLKICQFNATHHVPRSEYQHHLMTCPDKIMMEHELRYEAREGQVIGGCTKVPLYRDINIPDSEDWDSDIHDVTNTFTGISLYQKDDQPRQQPLSATSGLNRSYTRPGEQVIFGNTRPQPPRFQPLEQPVSSIYANSLGRGRARRIQQAEQSSMNNRGYMRGRGRRSGPIPVPSGFSASSSNDWEGEMLCN